MEGTISVITVYGKDHPTKEEGTIHIQKNVEVEYTRKQDLCIHRPVNESNQTGYTITHILTGLALHVAQTKKKAKDFIKALSGIDWTKKYLTKEKIIIITRAIIDSVPAYGNFYTKDEINRIVNHSAENFENYYKKYKNVIDSFEQELTRF